MTMKMFFFWFHLGLYVHFFSLIEGRGQSMSFPGHNVLSLRHVEQSPVCYRHPHTSGHNTAGLTSRTHLHLPR